MASTPIQRQQSRSGAVQYTQRHLLQRRDAVHHRDLDDDTHRRLSDAPGLDSSASNNRGTDARANLLEQISNELLPLFSPDEYWYFRDVFVYHGVHRLLQELGAGVRWLLVDDAEDQQFADQIMRYLMRAADHYSDHWGSLGLLAITYKTLDMFTGQFNDHERSFVGDCLENAIQALRNILKWQVFIKAQNLYRTGIAVHHPNVSGFTDYYQAFQVEFGDIISSEWIGKNIQLFHSLMRAVRYQNEDNGVQLLGRFIMVHISAPDQRHMLIASALSSELEAQLLEY
ncbi:hypothetical protein H4R34_002599 [Dimargaris verticillata]|uniref:Uncharacterized protein n=1 Tax=Dimargaris verticillata TaxID=2761393 RepID=A0A9W8EDX8_9FUNG|nr:hypothetical protein H4R34_002599 [Dimargaris verticillata]